MSGRTTGEPVRHGFVPIILVDQDGQQSDRKISRMAALDSLVDVRGKVDGSAGHGTPVAAEAGAEVRVGWVAKPPCGRQLVAEESLNPSNEPCRRDGAVPLLVFIVVPSTLSCAGTILSCNPKSGCRFRRWSTCALGCVMPPFFGPGL